VNRVLYSYLAAALIDLLIGAMVLSFPYVAQFLGAGNLGTISNGIVALVYILVCLFFSTFRIFKERRHALVVGCLMFSLGCLLMVFTTSKAALFYVPALVSAGSAFFYPALLPWVTEGMSRSKIVKTTGGYSIAWVLGYLMGPFLAGIVLSSSLPFEFRIHLIFGTAALVSFLIGLSFLPNLFPRHIECEEIHQDIHGGKTAISSRPLFVFIKVFWIANFTAFFLNGLIRYVFTELGKTEGLSPFWVGNVNSILFGAFVLVTLFLRRTHFWIFSPAWLMIFQLSAIPAILCFTFSRHLAFYLIGAVLFGIVSGFTFFSSTSYSLMLEGEKDKMINFNEALIGSGGFLSALTGYLFAQFIHVKFSFLPGLLLMAVAVFFQLRLIATLKNSDWVPALASNQKARNASE
jgi:MFS family permease